MSKASKKLDRNTIQRVLQLIRPYKGMVILTLTLALITVVTTLLAPVLAGRAVDKIVGPGQVDYQGLGRIALAMAATITCTALSQWLMNVVNNRITFQVVRDMRVRVFEQLEILPLKYMDAHRPGDAISRITTDVEQFSDGLLMGFTQLFTGVLTILGTLGVMLYIDWRIALVGPTGCGKTTLVNLLMRFYEINSGTLRVDGHPIDTVTRDSLRANLGMVLQETWLKAGTIAENIAYGKPDATREEIIAAAKKARAHSFICRLPNGYDTQVAEDGGNISQGQRQLLCIARVMLRRPPILILDEATSSIDTRTEVLVQDAFEELMKGRTSFIVAHRLSTIKNADQILVMKAGNIIERGTHDELLAQGGFYKQLYESQFAKA